MSDLRELAGSVAEAFQGRARRFASASLAMKFGFAALSALSVIAQFTGSDKLTVSHYVGIGTAAAAAVAAIYVAFTDQDSSSELEIARQAVSKAQELENDYADALRQFADQHQDELEQIRAGELYQAMNAMRGVIERVLAGGDTPTIKAIELLFEVAGRSLQIALGFQMAEHHTLCVYIAEQDPGTRKTVLRCVAHSRTIDCPIENARRWFSGVGVAGAAYARGTEVVVPDMTSLQIGSLYRDQRKEEDLDRYRSVAVVPVLLGSDCEPWGVVVGTSDRINHFSVGADVPGVQTVEAIRALAGMVALAVRATESRPACRGAHSGPVQADSGQMAVVTDQIGRRDTNE